MHVYSCVLRDIKVGKYTQEAQCLIYVLGAAYCNGFWNV